MPKAKTISGILLLGGAGIAGFFLLKTAFSTGNPRTDCLRRGKAWLQFPGESGRCLTPEQKEAALFARGQAGIENWKAAERDRLIEDQAEAETALGTRFSVLYDEYYRRRIPAPVLQSVWCSYYRDGSGEWYRPDRVAAVLEMWGPGRVFRPGDRAEATQRRRAALQQVGLQVWPTLNKERRAAFWADVVAASDVGELDLLEEFRAGPQVVKDVGLLLDTARRSGPQDE